MLTRRRAGILMHISSLPNNYSIGSIGDEAFRFIDFLKSSGMSYWQFLPLNAVFSDPSPYASISSIGYNIYLISLEKLVDYGLLESMPISIFSKNNTKVDYEKLFPYKKTILKKAHERFLKMTTTSIYSDYLNFCYDNDNWLNDLALFVSIKEYFIYKRKRDAKENDLEEYEKFKKKYENILSESKINDFFYGGAMLSWPDDIKFRDKDTLLRYSLLLSEKVSFYKFTQFIFYKQWDELHQYAKKNGIKLIGDIPIFINYDSVDVWTHPNLFFLDDDLLPTKIAGVPPDYFSKTGQLWNNPLYKWSEHQADGYAWWKRRFENLFKLSDVIRIDHFRGFDSYWSVPYSEKTAINGAWEKGPGEDFFNVLFEKRTLPIIAEDLGLITDSVTKLRKQFSLPGMFVSHFHLLNYKSFEDLNANTDSNNVIYSGTHDNQTSKSWLNELPDEAKRHISTFMDCAPEEIDVYKLLEVCGKTKFNTLIIPFQDLLELDDSARMNVPGTIQDNWEWRYEEKDLTSELAKRIHDLLESSDRLSKNRN